MSVALLPVGIVPVPAAVQGEVDVAATDVRLGGGEHLAVRARVRDVVEDVRHVRARFSACEIDGVDVE